MPAVTFNLLCLDTTVFASQWYSAAFLAAQSAQLQFFVHGFPLENVRAGSLGIEWG